MSPSRDIAGAQHGLSACLASDESICMCIIMIEPWIELRIELQEREHQLSVRGIMVKMHFVTKCGYINC